jgi:hypothetical protein
LHIVKGNAEHGFQLEDGTQGEGKVLTSDANGVGTWRDATPKIATNEIYVGEFEELSIIDHYFGGNLHQRPYRHTNPGSEVTLPPGLMFFRVEFVMPNGSLGNPYGADALEFLALTESSSNPNPRDSDMSWSFYAAAGGTARKNSISPTFWQNNPITIVSIQYLCTDSSNNLPAPGQRHKLRLYATVLIEK